MVCVEAAIHIQYTCLSQFSKAFQTKLSTHIAALLMLSLSLHIYTNHAVYSYPSVWYTLSPLVLCCTVLGSIELYMYIHMCTSAFSRQTLTHTEGKLFTHTHSHTHTHTLTHTHTHTHTLTHTHTHTHTHTNEEALVMERSLEEATILGGISTCALSQYGLCV